ncbi:unnamed protein product [Paramecium pentaurelia]|uniref:Inosine/uridine-preferring nucleoside hydrolase domain-containing protein n=1 Tax=Paramecium pentaurelia TaxID=43138 RepID=A0A8S1SP76_9CILI|nr:unnamed protein product [Paramecium pentaurelia]
MKQLDSRLPSAIHSRRILTQFTSALDISRINLKSRSQIRCKTEGTILKTEHGTCTTEDEFLPIFGSVDLWSILGQRDFYFTQSPKEIKLLQQAECEINLTFMDIQTMIAEIESGYITSKGQLCFKQNQLLKQTKLLYITPKQSQQCIYICLIQGMQSNMEVQQNFKNFLLNIWKCETKKLCAGCYFEYIHILVWDYLKQQTWIISGQDLDLQHIRSCQNFSNTNTQYRGKKVRRILFNSNDNQMKVKSASLKQSFHQPKLVIEDKINFVMDFIKPIIQEKDRINDVVVMKKTLLRPKSSKKLKFDNKNLHSKGKLNQYQKQYLQMISLPSFIKHQFGIPEKLLKQRTKMIIDTDSGGDDIHALLTAFDLAAKKNIEIIGITCINGNSQIDDGIKNITIVQKIAGINVPIYKGCDRNLKQKITLSSKFFGDDGLSGHQEKYLKELNISQYPLQPQHAVDFLIESAVKYKEELIIICLGALTNVACAMMKTADFEENIGLVIGLCGNILGLGFMNDGVAEYNVHTDPEAAHLVFKVLAKKLIVIPYEGVISVSEFTITKVFEQDTTIKGKFIKEIYEGMKNANNRYDIQDPLCILVATMPDIITEYVERPCNVILEGEGRGMISVKWLDKDPQASQVTFILKVNENQLIQTLSNVVN